MPVLALFMDMGDHLLLEKEAGRMGVLGGDSLRRGRGGRLDIFAVCCSVRMTSCVGYPGEARGKCSTMRPRDMGAKLKFQKVMG